MTTPAQSEEVARIAEGLSEAQRAFLELLPIDGSWKLTTEYDTCRHGPNALRRFGQSGLIDGYYREVMRHRLTPLGAAVRHHLTKDH